MCCSWGVCITRRGIVYFGASIHIFVTLILFAGTTFRAYRISTYIREDNRKELLGGVIIATYFFVLLILGCLIFKGIEQKNSKLLGWTGGIFITLETFAFVFNLIILSPMGGVYDEYGIRNFGFTVDTTHIIISCIFLGFMMAYCGTIIMYISKLKEDGDVSHSDYTTYGDLDDAGAAVSSKTSSRTPSTYFNQRSQSQSQLDNQKPMAGGGFGDFKLLSIIAQAKAAQQQQHSEPQGQGQIQPKQVKPPKVPLHQSSQVVQASTQPPMPQTKTTTISIPQEEVLHAPEPRTHTQQTQTQTQQLHMQQQQQQPFHSQTQYAQLHTPGPQIHYSQTLPHSHHYQRRLQQQEYNNMNHQRGPTFTSSPAVTASVAPNRFRNPNPIARTTAAGTLGRYEPHNHSLVVGSRTHTLQRQNASSSCSSMDHANYDIDQWEQPRVQALKYNYPYNALRRGTHRSDYGTLGVEV